MLAQHREIHVVLDRNIRSEATAQESEDIEVFQPYDVWSQRNTACTGIDRSRNSDHDMTRPRDIDPDGARELAGAGGDLFGHVRCPAWGGGLGQLRDDATLHVSNRCGELRAAQVRRKAIGSFARHCRALTCAGGGRGRAAANSATPKNSSCRRRKATDKAPTTPARLPRVLVRISTGRGASCNSTRATLSAKSGRAPTEPPRTSSCGSTVAMTAAAARAVSRAVSSTTFAAIASPACARSKTCLSESTSEPPASRYRRTTPVAPTWYSRQPCRRDSACSGSPPIGR